MSISLKELRDQINELILIHGEEKLVDFEDSDYNEYNISFSGLELKEISDDMDDYESEEAYEQALQSANLVCLID